MSDQTTHLLNTLGSLRWTGKIEKLSHLSGGASPIPQCNSPGVYPPRVSNWLMIASG
jgi:hypothetical protein